MKRQKKGFTIVETSIATTFLAVIILSVAILTVQMTRIYQKGITMRAINSSGQAIIEDITRIVGSADYLYNPSELGERGSLNYAKINDARGQFFAEKVKNVTGGTKTQKFGSFCVGQYAYVWNTAEVLRRDGDTVSGLIDDIGIKVNGSPIRFARIPSVDKDGSNVCTVVNEQDSINLKYNPEDEIVELVGNSDAGLAVYDFTVYPSAQSTTTHQSYVPISFILATLRGGVNVTADSDFCEGNPPTGSNFERSDLDYCAVNKFDFSVQTGGSLSKN